MATKDKYILKLCLKLLSKPKNVSKQDLIKIRDEKINPDSPLSIINYLSRNLEDKGRDYPALKEKIKNKLNDLGFSSTFLDHLFYKMDRNFDAVVLVVKRDFLIEHNKSYLLDYQLLKNRKISYDKDTPLCNNIEFSDQKSAFSIGTGFFVAKGLVATAAHLLFPHKDLTNEIAFIRGFSAKKIKLTNNYPSKNNKTGKITPISKIKIDAKDVFFPENRPYLLEDGKLKYSAYNYTETNEDWAIVPTDQESDNYVKISDSRILYKQKTYCFGHGLGLPKTTTFKGTVIRHEPNKSYFECKMKAFAGNSGSPIFDEKHNVVGMLVRGTSVLFQDKQNKCFKFKMGTNLGEGEECQKMQPITNAIAAYTKNSVVTQPIQNGINVHL